MAAFRKFKLDWKKKALAFRFFDAAPLGHELYYLTQKNITRTVPRQLRPTSVTARRFLDHLEAMARHSGSPLSETTLFEFGAGWDLYGNLVMWCHGIQSQIVYDRSCWARPDQINIVIQHLIEDPPEAACRVPERLLDREDFRRCLNDYYGIRYCAPADAAQTNLPGGSADVILTTSVLEHIPETELRRLLVECRRLLKPGAIMSHVIDYSDHYSHSDPNIGPYHFLRFSEEEWKQFNPNIHYQNRLRHADYLRIFQESGFRVLEEHYEQPDDAAEILASLPLASCFRDRPSAELAPVVGQFVLTVAP